MPHQRELVLHPRRNACCHRREFSCLANDHEALAHSLPNLTAAECHQIGGGVPLQHATKAVIGPGTGLGVAALVSSQAAWAAVSGEGGHSSFAVEDAEEFALFARVQKEFGHVSAERLVSGPGLSRTYDILCEIIGQPPTGLTAAEIVGRAKGEADPLAARTVDLFGRWLGRFAGDIALAFGARGGVYIAGGIPPRILSNLTLGSFRKSFETKGRMTDYMKSIPVYVIVVDDAGLKGAAALLSACGSEAPA